MRFAENESRRVGMKFEAEIELSLERSDAGFLFHARDLKKLDFLTIIRKIACAN
jgi:hypothetical protein